jgi:hypothetical protein
MSSAVPFVFSALRMIMAIKLEFIPNQWKSNLFKNVHTPRFFGRPISFMCKGGGRITWIRCLVVLHHPALYSAARLINLLHGELAQVAALYFGISADAIPQRVLDILSDKAHGLPQFAKELVCLAALCTRRAQ